MLKSVRIRNYQSHKDTTIDLIEGTNVIIGASDTGKSALFRAINWVCTNRPLGDSFRSEWGGDTSVILETTDGHTIERIKGATRNEYIVDGQVLKAFGTEVPDIVSQVLQIDEASIRSQMDAPFLLASTPGEAARQLNTAASIDIIDTVITNLKRKQSQLNSGIEHNSKSIKDAQEQLQDYDNLLTIEGKLTKVEQEKKIENELRSRITSLSRIHSQGQALKTRVHGTAYIIPALDKLSDIESLYKACKDRHTTHTKLITIVSTAGKLQEQITTSDNVNECLALQKQIAESYDKFTVKKKELQNLLNATRTMNSIKNGIDILVRGIKELTERYNAIIPETCPLCGGEWGGKHEQ